MADPRRHHPRPVSYHVGDRLLGRFDATTGTRGGGYFVPDVEGAEDLRIDAEDCLMALHNDRVEVVISQVPRGRAPQAMVRRVVEHANRRIIAQLMRRGAYCRLVPLNPRIQRSIEIQREFPRDEVPDKAWVVVEIRQWSNSPSEPLIGSLVEVLGREDDPGLAVLLMVREAGIDLEFPGNVLTEAEALQATPPAKDPKIEQDGPRRDFRHERIFTVDPATAKDFDDAIGLIEESETGWRVGVHIADVAHYVRPGTALDAEGYDRATSIYPIDRVVPMLPEALSNDLCSLRPGVERFTMTALMTITRDGAIHDVELCQGRIHSIRRFAYEEVQGLFDQADGWADPELPPSKYPIPTIPPPLYEDLLAVREAARSLRRARQERGMLDLDLPEPEYVFGEDRQVSDIRRKERFEAHRMIEDLMIAANEAVAHTLEAEDYATLYRVHEEPQDEKLEPLRPILGRFGIRLPNPPISQSELQRALEQARKHPSGAVLQRWVLRAMKRACYQPENIGHYGLGSESYLHFTSPIRRYPDLLTHRVVKARLGGLAPDAPELAEMVASLHEAGRHCSSREERAQRMEWDAQAMLGLQFMQKHLGGVFEGFISGMNAKGVFIELNDYPVEGMVLVRDITGDYYHWNEVQMIWQGEGTGHTLSLGQQVRVRIMRINVLHRQMDLKLLDLPQRTGRRESGGRGRPQRSFRPPKKNRRGGGRRRH